MPDPKKEYPENSLGNLMNSAIPTCKPHEQVQELFTQLTDHQWEDVNHIFVLDKHKELLGIIPIHKLRISTKSKFAKDLMDPVKYALKPKHSNEKVIVNAIKYETDIIPIVDDDNRFLGAILPKTIINIMHGEHLESMLHVAGIHGKKTPITKLATAEIPEVIKSRLPWLIIGLFFGLSLGYISSFFEESLKSNVAIAFFIPVIAYIADSVGTQAQTISVRALAFLNINNFIYLSRELLIGIILGLVMGIFGGLGAILITWQVSIGFVVGLSLFFASAISSVLASALPILFKIFKIDPALGSGPLTTVLQDVISILIYFLIAFWFL